LIKNSQLFGKKFQKTVGGIFFDSHYRCPALWPVNKLSTPETLWLRAPTIVCSCLCQWLCLGVQPSDLWTSCLRQRRSG